MSHVHSFSLAYNHRRKGQMRLSVVEPELPKRHYDAVSVFYVVSDNDATRYVLYLLLAFLRPANLERMKADDEI